MKTRIHRNFVGGSIGEVEFSEKLVNKCFLRDGNSTIDVITFDSHSQHERSITFRYLPMFAELCFEVFILLLTTGQR